MLKKILFILIFVIGGILIFKQRNNEPVPNSVSEEVILEAVEFEGLLEEVNTGCFADGECFVVVDGKHVTAIMGWSRETVGSVQGAKGFGDLENHIGERVEVYARDLGDGKYTLYGSESFYIKLNRQQN